MLTPDETEALLWRGITPPAPGWRTTCPVCSPRRKKWREKCLRIWRADWGLEWECLHCGLEDGETT